MSFPTKMSFKRIGDDPTALRVQKKQRVTELLLEDIPEDEATLLKNGRFACLVCKHCPVFDTVAVLSIHRQGKKHLSNAKVRLEKLREDAELQQKREHMKYMETLAADPSEEAAPLLKITQQKKELALQGSTEFTSKQGPEEERNPNNVPFFESRKPVDLSIKDATTTGLKGTESKKTSSSSEKGNRPTADTQPLTKPLKNDQTVKSSNGKCSLSSQKKAELSPSEQARREHFSRLRQAGWIMGLDGKWYKDEDAEFDSDEDEPPPPP